MGQVERSGDQQPSIQDLERSLQRAERAYLKTHLSLVHTVVNQQVPEEVDTVWRAYQEAEEAVYRAKIEDFSRRRKEYSGIPDRLKTIAIDAAVAALQLPDLQRVLEREVEAVDAAAETDPFIRYDRQSSGSLVVMSQEFEAMLQRRGISADEISRRTRTELRAGIARRRARAELAEELGYRPGNEQAIIRNTHFVLASQLAAGAVAFVKAGMRPTG